MAVQQSLKRAFARVAGGVAESAVTLLWTCLSALGLDHPGPGEWLSQSRQRFIKVLYGFLSPMLVLLGLGPHSMIP